MALLDTSFLIDLMKEAKRRRPGSAAQKLDELIRDGENLRIAIFTVGELFVGVAKGSRPIQEREAVEKCLTLFDILSFERPAAEIFGAIVGDLERRGQSISDMDALIASVAMENGERLVTRNTRHFLRINGLMVESY